ncbi:MAG: DUF4350 domain-containing protein [Chloroflexi bacterium]|nr:DUF4350 domain-containing protein [Chloroflexota bacterium]
MSRIRSSMLLLGIAVAAILIGGLRLLTEQAQLPAGSSASAQPDGALALYTWLGDLGGQTQRLSDTAIDPSASTVVILEPPAILDQATRDALDAFTDRGGTIVLAGDSLPWLISARTLGVTVEPAAQQASTATTPDGLSLPLTSRYRLRAGAAGAEPLLLRDDGDWVGLNMPYRDGNLIVIASPEPLTNAGLADDATARFVFRELVSPAIGSGQSVAFDEIDRSGFGSGTAAGTPNMAQLLFQTSPGRAILYAAVLTFVFLVLAGRRLGPPVYLRSAADSPRTMYEHVQMLANLYRRAGQLRVVRETLGRHYARALARGALPPSRAAALSGALAGLDSATTESELVTAIATIETLQ